MFFKRKKNDGVYDTPVCVHEWYLIDYQSEQVYCGVDVDVVDKYTVGCVKCNKTKVVDQYDYNAMIELGLIKNVIKNKINNK